MAHLSQELELKFSIVNTMKEKVIPDSVQLVFSKTAKDFGAQDFSNNLYYGVDSQYQIKQSVKKGLEYNATLIIYCDSYVNYSQTLNFNFKNGYKINLQKITLRKSQIQMKVDG